MLRKIKLLLVTKSTGGTATYIRMLIRGLNRERFEITVACLSECGKEFAHELKDEYGVDAFSLAMNRYKINPLTDAWVLVQLASKLRSGRYDVVHAHASKPGFLARIAAIGSGIPVIYSPHNFAFHEGTKPLVAHVVIILERFAAKFTSKIVAVAHHERELALKYGVGTPQLYTVIPTGIDPNPFVVNTDINGLRADLGIPSRSWVVGAVGRLAIPKLPLDFVNTAAILHCNYPDMHFVWVGDGPLKIAAIQLTRQRNLEDVVHWLGHRSDVNVLYPVFDCFLLLSKWEASPLVILEAFASGIPVIASDNSGARELISEDNDGILVDVGNVQATVDAIRFLLENPSKAKAISKSAGDKLMRRYTVEKMVSSIEDLYLQNATKI